MKEQIDGGRAFPRDTIFNARHVDQEGSSGMSLRDWFAGMALQGVALYERGKGTPWPDKAKEELALSAKLAYMLADSMIAAREEK